MNKLRGCMAVVLMAIFFSNSLVASASQTEVDRLKEESENASQQVNDINSQKQQAESAKEQLQSQATSLSGQITDLNTQITTVTGEISETEVSIAAVEADIDDLNDKLDKTQKSLENQKESMSSRIVYMYENKSTNTLVNYLESGSMAEFLQRLEYMQNIAEYDQSCIEKFEATELELEETKAAIQEKSDELTSYKGKLKSKKSNLGTLVNNTASALNTTNTQIADTDAAIAELEKQLAEAKEKEKRLQQQYQAAQVALAEKLAGEHGGYTGGYSTTDEETLILAALIQAEAANQGDAGRLAVGSVVMNRVASGRFPNSVSGVIYSPGQFAPVTSGRVAIILAEGPNSACQRAAAQAISGSTNTDALFFCTYSYAQNLHNSQVGAEQAAAEAEGREPREGIGFLDRTSGTTINAHYFYNYN
ncbi:MAG: cell wall hydrolase [Pseudobutyrivibrio sp.]|nr:cell wall hydrolase [Pseudobutyrivibrio sp.]